MARRIAWLLAVAACRFDSGGMASSGVDTDVGGDTDTQGGSATADTAMDTQGGGSSGGAEGGAGPGVDSSGAGADSGDGSTSGVDPCADPGACDPDASCAPDATGLQPVCTCAPELIGDGQLCTTVPTLPVLRVDVPCGVDADEGQCEATNASEEVVLEGEPGQRFRVTLWIRGVVEEKPYTCAQRDGNWCTKGDGQAGDNRSDTELAIGMPPLAVRLNHGQGEACVLVDMQHDVVIESGALVSLQIDPRNDEQRRNDDGLVVPALDPAPAAFDGQFLQVEAIAFVPI